MRVPDGLTQYARQMGFELPSELDHGKIARFRRSGSRKKNCWALGLFNSFSLIYAKFGDHKTKETYEFRTGRSLKPVGFKRPIQNLAVDRQIEVARRHWKDFQSACRLTLTEYSHRKRLGSLFGARSISGFRGGEILVPLQDVQGTFGGYQRILSDGTKLFGKGQRKLGNFFLIGKPDSQLIVCEGYATGCSLYQAKKLPTACSLDCGNLVKVVRSFRAKYPDLRIVVAGDFDQFTVPPDGTKKNPGQEKANEASLYADAVVFPSFLSLASKPTDFNDLHALEGLVTVHKQIQEVLNAN